MSVSRGWTPSRQAVLLVIASLAACAGPSVDEPTAEFSFTKDRQGWRATAVSAQVQRLDAATGRDGTVGVAEWTVQIVARRDPEGEQLTLFVVAPTVEGRHPVRVFGALLGFAARPAVPVPVTNVCGSGSLAGAGEAAGGTLQIDHHDTKAHTLSGSFRVNVCDVQQPADARTLAEGVIRDVHYRPANGR